MLTAVDRFFTDLFRNLQENFWTTFFILFTGILLGIIIAGGIYAVMLMISIRKDKQFKVEVKELSTPDESRMLMQVADIKKRYLESTEGMSVAEKLQGLGSTVYETINIIAGEYYPNSKYPLYELTVDELLQFMHYLSDRIEGILSKKLLRPFKRMTISQVFRFLDTKKKIEEAKVIKAANKMKLGKVSRMAFAVMNYANPVYWFKKLVIGGTFTYVVNKTSQVVIDIVADETSKMYSKSIFNQERNLQIASVEEALQEMEEEGDEDQ